MIRVQKMFESRRKKRKATPRLQSRETFLSQDFRLTESWSLGQAIELERHERRVQFPLALGRHAQNATILIVLLVVDGLVSKST